MTLGTILLFSASALLYGALLPARWRGWALLVVSVIAVYALQPALPIRYSGFILPTVMLLLIVASWWTVREKAETQPDDQATFRRLDLTRDDLTTLIVIIILIIAVSFLRFIHADYRLVASTPPPPETVIVSLVVVGILGAAIAIASRRVTINQKQLLTAMILLIVAFFVVFKTEPLATELSRILRSQSGQNTSLASMIDLGWVGFSYAAFRLIHTLRDKQTGILPALTLREYMTYVIFFPAFTAGPIDRAARFIVDYRSLPTPHRLYAIRFTPAASQHMHGPHNEVCIADQ